MPSLFLSYRRADSPDTVKLIRERLSDRLPRWDIFYDHESIGAGEEFPDLLRQKVTSANAALVIIGPKWRDILHQRRADDVDHVRTEVRLALESGASVVPVVVGNAPMPTATDLAEFAGLSPLLQRNARLLRPDPDFDNDLERIIGDLEQLDTSEAVGAILARKYTLTELIGEGGMGLVFAARQKQPVKRTVAVKLIKPGMDSREVLARFEAERQALAVMDHPNIAKVLDAGTTASARPFFVMEFVHGLPITQHCDNARLSVKDRLRLFIPVCQAVQHAHQKSIIHRDLKPSNVLVEAADGKPTPKVIDFGVAKALGGHQELTDRTLYTTIGSRLGTPEYSAPEQLAGQAFEVDTRSDIYSLGVLLYELLTGALPFTREELTRMSPEQIRENEPVKPSRKALTVGAEVAARRGVDPKKLRRALRGDLDWIVMKCLAREQGRRYETASQVADELQRCLSDEPVQARPPTARYRTGKFLRRNKGLVAAALLLFLAVTGGLIGTTIGLIGEARQLAESQESLGNAVDAVDKMLTEVASTDLENVPLMTQTRKKVLMKAKDLTERLLSRYPTDKKVRQAAGKVYLNLGDVHELLGNMPVAEEYYQQATAVVLPLTHDYPDAAEYRHDLGAIYHGEAVVWSKGIGADKAKAEQRFDEAIRLRQLLVDENSANLDLQRDLAASIYQRAALLAKLKGRIEEARSGYDATVKLQRALVRQDPANPEYEAALARTLNNKGLLLWSQSQRNDAEKLFAEATQRQKELTQRFPDVAAYRSALARYYGNRGSTFARDPKEALKAEENYKEALRWFEELAKDFPKVPKYSQDLAGIHDHLGKLWADMKRLADAREEYEKALQLRRKITELPDDRLKLAQAIMVIGALLHKQGQLAEAKKYHREAVQISKELVAESSQVPKYHVNLGNCLNQHGRLLEDLHDQGQLLDRAQVCALIAGTGCDRFLPGAEAVLYSQVVLSDSKTALEESKKALEEALLEHRQALDVDPENVRKYLRDDYVFLTRVLCKMGQVESAFACAEGIPPLFPGDNKENAFAAYLLAWLIPAAEGELANRIGRRAVELLEQAVAQGFDRNNLSGLSGPRYGPLRSRSDFQKLISNANK